MSNTECAACGTESDGTAKEVTFEEALEAFNSRKFWISFFVRPCCPPPGQRLALHQLDHQRDLVNAREDFTDDQKAQLLAAIDGGEAWYRTTPYWAKGANN